MILLKTFIMKCKLHCTRILSVLDDSHNYETAVEAFIKESEGKINIDNQEEDNDTLHDKGNLYSEPTNEYYQVDSTDDASVDSDEQKDLFNEKSIIPNEMNQILEMCDNIPPEIIMSPLNTNKIETKLNEEKSEKKHIDIENSQHGEIDDSSSIILALTEIIEELDSVYKQSDDSNVHTTIEFCQNRIIEVLLSNGCSEMEEFAFFNSTHHVTSPFSIIKNGTEIQSYLRNGVIYKGKVLLKAIVKTKE